MKKDEESQFVTFARWIIQKVNRRWNLELAGTYCGCCCVEWRAVMLFVCLLRIKKTNQWMEG